MFCQFRVYYCREQVSVTSMKTSLQNFVRQRKLLNSVLSPVASVKQPFTPISRRHVLWLVNLPKRLSVRRPGCFLPRSCYCKDKPGQLRREVSGAVRRLLAALCARALSARAGANIEKRVLKQNRESPGLWVSPGYRNKRRQIGSL